MAEHKEAVVITSPALSGPAPDGEGAYNIQKVVRDSADPTPASKDSASSTKAEETKAKRSLKAAEPKKPETAAPKPPQDKPASDAKVVTPPAEANKPEGDSEVEKDPKVASKLAVLAKKEAAARKARDEAEAKQRELADQLKGLDRLKGIEQRIKDDPVAVLREFGRDLDPKLWEQLLAGIREETPADREVREIKAQLKRQEDERAAAETQARDEAIRQQNAQAFKGLVDFATTNNDDFELVNALGAHQQAWNAMFRAFQQTGEMPGDGTPEGAMRWALGDVEAYLEKQADAILKTGKLSKRFAPPEQPKPPLKKPAPTLKGAIKDAAPPPAEIPKDLSMDDRKRLVAERFRGTLKKSA